MSNYFGPYGSIPVNNEISNNPNCINHTCIQYCPTQICLYRQLQLPSFLTSNIQIPTTLSLNFTSDIGLITYYQSSSLSYTLDNQGESTSTDTTVVTNTITVVLRLDSFMFNNATYPSLQLTLTKTPSINTVTQSVTGSDATLFNIVVAYKNIINCGECMTCPMRKYIQTDCYEVISITVSFT